MKKLLFVCSQNKLRSPTAEQIFCQFANVDVRSAGLNNDALNRLSSEDVEWADYIFPMEKAHRNKLLSKFKTHIKDQRVIVLNIPDEYEYMDETLIQLLKHKVHRYIR